MGIGPFTACILENGRRSPGKTTGLQEISKRPKSCFESLISIFFIRYKAWFPYDRPDRPSRLKKKCSDDRDDYMEMLVRRSQTLKRVVTARNRNSSSWNMVLAEGALCAERALTESSLLDSEPLCSPRSHSSKELAELVGQFRHVRHIHRSRFLFRRDTVWYHLPHGTATLIVIDLLFKLVPRSIT